MAATANLLRSTLSKRPDGTDRPDAAPAADGTYRPVPRYTPEAPAVIGVRGPLLAAVPEPGPAPDDSGAFSAESAESEPPLTSEPPMADAAPLTSEPPLADAAPLTSEPTATGTAAGTDPSVE
ncbi:hypothetical protein GCM10018793_62130 [Streptomyces sulfonofaciens]|uniref:Uncharacterized protein n=1 Tax=Streptomyces sulfonofaciens TaxID=68272 RepID=A0A919GM90_9ACTN|nr:hypothetical protein [Streptomyces sulfonofaciens]GHH87197.1 hypothetical protein GCM10018793_62130 [Streptomyces sulfonofaciens]